MSHGTAFVSLPSISNTHIQGCCQSLRAQQTVSMHDLISFIQQPGKTDSIGCHMTLMFCGNPPLPNEGEKEGNKTTRGGEREMQISHL